MFMNTKKETQTSLFSWKRKPQSLLANDLRWVHPHVETQSTVSRSIPAVPRERSLAMAGTAPGAAERGGQGFHSAPGQRSLRTPAADGTVPISYSAKAE